MLITPIAVLWASYYTCNFVRDVNPRLSKCEWNLFCDNHVIITYWLKSVRKFTFLKHHSFFWKHAVTVNLKKFSSNTIFRWYTFRKLWLFNYFSGRPNKVKERFWNVSDWALCGWYMTWKCCWYLLKILVSLSSVSTLYHAGQSTQDTIAIIPWLICVLFICIESDLFKSSDYYVLFFPFEKSFKYYEKLFQFHHYMFLKKILLLNKPKTKCVIRKRNLYFLTSWKIVKFYLQKFVISIWSQTLF